MRSHNHNNSKESKQIMNVQKRSGELEEVSFDKVLNRLKKLCFKDLTGVNVVEVAQKICSRIYDGVATSELDELAAALCSSLAVQHLDYGTLAARLAISNHHKRTSPSFADVVDELYRHTDEENNHSPLVNREFHDVVMANREVIQWHIDYDRDYLLDYFGFKTLEKSYLLRDAKTNTIIERPQHMWMRVAVAIHGDVNNMQDAIETYDLLSKKYMTHATPTLFNAGTPKQQLSSCFLLALKDDSIQGIYDTISDCAQISKYSGGIGIHISNVRCKGSRIRGTNGMSDGIIPMLRVFNSTARYVNQSGKRNGSIAVYLEPWHGDVEDFLELRKNTGTEEERCRDLFLALWMNDVFMERVHADEMWSLMCPDQCPGLQDVYGDAFRDLYTKYENQNRFIKQMRAQDLWRKILESQIETGTPYILYKDSINAKSNHKHLGVIKSSNLCVAPDTKILTRQRGYVNIVDVADTVVDVWNGEEWSAVKVLKTGTEQALITVQFSNGMELRCTPYHKFFVQTGHNDNPTITTVEAEQLRPGDKLVQHDLPDHTDESVKPYLEWYLGSFPDLMCPILDIQKEAFFAMQSIGIHPRMVTTSTGGNKTFSIQLDYEGVRRLFSYMDGCVPLSLSQRLPAPQVKRFGAVTVKSVMDFRQCSDTYCFQEPKRHAGMFNGVLTSQCSEIVEYSSPGETAVCNLASISLPAFVLSDTRTIDFQALHRVTQVITRNLDKIIDINFYPIESARASNMLHRPIGIGVQGLADVFAMLRIPFDSAEAREINRHIFETIYHGAITASMNLARETNSTYPSFAGSPLSNGIFQFDMWYVDPTSLTYNWDALRRGVMKYGVRNSMLIAPMPTASTAQILGNNESFEPYTSNIYKRKTMSGEFIIINKHLMKELIALNLWNADMRDALIASDGSIQHIENIPDTIKNLYKTVWEIKQRSLIDMAADRGAFIDQSQSLSIFLEAPDIQTLTSMHFYGWRKGLKTGMYYLRTRPRAHAQKFTVDPSKTTNKNTHLERKKCTMQDDNGACLMCSS